MPKSARLLGHWTSRVAALNPIPDGMPIIRHAREEGDRIAHDVMCQRTEEFVRWHWQPLHKVEVRPSSILQALHKAFAGGKGVASQAAKT